MKVFVIGATGQVGRHLVTRLAEGGHAVRALHRKPEQADALAAQGAIPVRGDLAEIAEADLAQAMTASETIVFSAGAGGAGAEVTEAIDGRGLERAVAAAKSAGIARFVLVSAFPEAGRDRERSDGFEHYMRIKKRADVSLVASGIDYVILRPGKLTDEPGTGHVRADLAIPYGSVSREDVAAALAGIVERTALSRTIIELTEGETPLTEALDRLAVRRI